MCDRPYLYHRQDVELLLANANTCMDPRIADALRGVQSDTATRLTAREEAIAFGVPVRLYGITIKRVVALTAEELCDVLHWLRGDAYERARCRRPYAVHTWGVPIMMRFATHMHPKLHELATAPCGFVEAVVPEPGDTTHTMFVLLQPAVIKACVGM